MKGHELLGRLEAHELIWRVVGEMTFSAVPVLLSQSRNLLRFSSDITIDLKNIRHADSSGLALMLEWMDWARAAGGHVRFSNIPESLLDIARISNVIDLVLSVERDKDDSVLLN